MVDYGFRQLGFADKFTRIDCFISNHDPIGLKKFLNKLGDNERVKLLSHQCKYTGFTPVLCAVQRGFLPVIKVLLLPDYQAPLDIPGYKNESLLGIALVFALLEEKDKKYKNDPKCKDNYIHLDNPEFIKLVNAWLKEGLRLNPECKEERWVQQSIKKYPESEIYKSLLKSEQQDQEKEQDPNKGIFSILSAAAAVVKFLNPPVQAAIELAPLPYRACHHKLD